MKKKNRNKVFAKSKRDRSLKKLIMIENEITRFDISNTKRAIEISVDEIDTDFDEAMSTNEKTCDSL